MINKSEIIYVDLMTSPYIMNFRRVLIDWIISKYYNKVHSKFFLCVHYLNNNNNNEKFKLYLKYSLRKVSLKKKMNLITIPFQVNKSLKIAEI